MKIVLTGGSGLVGRNFREHPGAANLEILAPDITDVDLTDFGAVKAYLSVVRPDMVIHAAGKVGGIQANIREPVGFFLANLDMGRNVVWASRELGITRLLNLGSSCMYPRGHQEPLREDQVLKGELESTNEGYALAKIAVSRLCDYICRENPAFAYKTLIPCNQYGRHDKFDTAHSHLIPAIIKKIHSAMRAGVEEVDIWGDGQARREFMYVGDLADLMQRAVQHFETLPSLMNVGLGHDYSIDEYYLHIAQAMNYRGCFVHDLGKPVGMSRKLVDISLQKKWGWRPTHNLAQGIKNTVEYYMEHCVR